MLPLEPIAGLPMVEIALGRIPVDDGEIRSVVLRMTPDAGGA